MGNLNSTLVGTGFKTRLHMIYTPCFFTEPFTSHNELRPKKVLFNFVLYPRSRILEKLLSFLLNPDFFGKDWWWSSHFFQSTVKVNRSCHSLRPLFFKDSGPLRISNSSLYSGANQPNPLTDPTFSTLRFTTGSIESQVRRDPTPFWRRWGYTGAIH